MLISRASRVLIVFVAMYLSACGGGGGDSSTSPKSSAPMVTLTANRTSIVTGQSVALSWSTANATACSASSAWSGTKATSGSESVTVDEAGTASYTLTCENTSGSAARTVTITAAAAVVSGKLFGPDGVTPVAGATVYAASATTLNALRPNRKAAPTASDCAPPTSAKLAFACTAVDGSFSFTVNSLSSDTFSLVAEKGMFRLTQTVAASVATAAGNLKLPKDVADGAPRMAFVTGNYGAAELVLAKLGLATLDLAAGKIDISTAAFSMFDGTITLQAGPPRYDLPDVSTLFDVDGATSLPKLHGFDIIVVDSSAKTTVLDSASNRDALRAYVENGGVLFVIDRSIDFVEQPMPEYLLPLGETDTNPQTPSAYYSGLGGPMDISIAASTDDALLAPWLQGVSCLGGNCLNSDGTIRLDRFDTVWVVLEGAHSAHVADVFATTRGMVALTAGTQERPLSVVFRLGEGQVIYSSYGSVLDSEPSTGLHPQERVLQYLLLAAGE
jgi:hypothetical protein